MRVCIFGDVMADIYRHITPTKLSQEAPVVVGLSDNIQYVPGGAGNAAANCAALGATAILVGIVGDDRHARTLAEALEAKDVLDRCVVSDSFLTICKERVVDSITGHQFVRIDREIRHPFIKEEAVIKDVLAEAEATCDCLLISDYDKGLCSHTLIRHAIECFKTAGKFIVVNGKPPHVRFYKEADIVTMNKAEWDMFTQSSSPAQFKAYMSTILPDTTVVITRGAEPLIVMRPDEREDEYYGCQKVDVADVSGAGDTLAAVLAVRGNSTRETFIEAVRIATEVVQYKGTAVPKTRLID